MPAVRSILAALSVVGTAALALAALAPAADEPEATPVVQLSAAVRPNRLPIPSGTPLTLTLDTRFSSAPPGGNFVLQRVEYLFGRGATTHGDLFPSCAAAKLTAARGRLSACPPGSQIGHGYAAGTAVAAGVSSSGKITLFNGPGGRSLTMNVSVLHPALVNKTVSLPLQRPRSGRYGTRIASTLPEEFKRILDGDIVLSRIVITTGATRLVHGARRGYIEATGCPRGGAPIHGDFVFNHDRSASADFTVTC